MQLSGNLVGSGTRIRLVTFYVYVFCDLSPILVCHPRRKQKLRMTVFPLLLCLFSVVTCTDFFDHLPNALFKRDDGSKSKSNSSSSSLSTTTSQSASKSSSISIDPALPAGGINLETPSSDSTTYVKSGSPVTFGWNYTSLSVSPSAINIEVSCSKNQQVYTLAQNQSLKSSSIVWDTNKVTESGGLHLISGEYTLMIYDSSKSSSEIASAGELSSFEYTFGIYVPQPYKAWPFAAKYVNVSVRITPPMFLTCIITLSGIIFAFLL